MHGPEGGRYPAGAALLVTPESVVFLGVQRRRRDFSEVEMAELTRVQHLLHHALALRTALDGMVVAPWGYRPTPREADVLSLMLRGWTNQRIARGLGISERTVRKHLSAVYEKVGTSGRAATAAWWQRQRDPR